MRNRLLALFSFLACSGVALLVAPSVADASRYADVKPNRLTMAQRAPLRVTVDISFPRSVTRVGEAIEYALLNSGYQLAPFAADDQPMLFNLPLPAVHREFQNTELAALLLALGQPGYDLVVDDANRLVSYQRTAPHAAK